MGDQHGHASTFLRGDFKHHNLWVEHQRTAGLVREVDKIHKIAEDSSADYNNRTSYLIVHLAASQLRKLLNFIE
jgi:hypothetical protein